MLALLPAFSNLTIREKLPNDATMADALESLCYVRIGSRTDGGSRDELLPFIPCTPLKLGLEKTRK